MKDNWDAYSDRINHLQDCIDFLHLFSTSNQEILKSNIGEMRMGIKSVENDLIDINAIEIKPIYYRSNDNTIKYKHNRYFENKIDELVAARSRDVLSEKSVRNAELSADAAVRSANSAEEANKIAHLSLKESKDAKKISICGIIVSALVAIIVGFISAIFGAKTIQFIVDLF